MGGITGKITEFIKDLLTGWITSNLDTMFTDVNTNCLLYTYESNEA